MGANLLAKYGGGALKMAEEANSLAIDPVMQEKARKIVGHFNLPIIGVHHMEAHALIARLLEQDLRFPSVALPVSSVHNLPVLAHSLGQCTQLGTTINDAIGEAFDKTTKWLALDTRKKWLASCRSYQILNSNKTT